MVYALQNGATLDYGDGKAAAFDMQCPDGGRVVIHGERVDRFAYRLTACFSDEVV